MSDILGDAKDIGGLVLIGGLLYFLSSGFQVRVAGNEVFGFGRPGETNTGNEGGSGNQPPATTPASSPVEQAVRGIVTGGTNYFPSFFGLDLFNSRINSAPVVPVSNPYSSQPIGWGVRAPVVPDLSNLGSMEDIFI